MRQPEGNPTLRVTINCTQPDALPQSSARIGEGRIGRSVPGPRVAHRRHGISAGDCATPSRPAEESPWRGTPAKCARARRTGISSSWKILAFSLAMHLDESMRGMLPRTLLWFRKPGSPEERPSRRTVETACGRVTSWPPDSNRHTSCSNLESELESQFRDNGPDDHSSCHRSHLASNKSTAHLFSASLSPVMGKWPSQGRRRT